MANPLGGLELNRFFSRTVRKQYQRQKKDSGCPPNKSPAYFQQRVPGTVADFLSVGDPQLPASHRPTSRVHIHGLHENSVFWWSCVDAARAAWRDALVGSFQSGHAFKLSLTQPGKIGLYQLPLTWPLWHAGSRQRTGGTHPDTTSLSQSVVLWKGVFVDLLPEPSPKREAVCWPPRGRDPTKEESRQTDS